MASTPTKILVPLQSKTKNGKTAFTEVRRDRITNIEHWKVYNFAYMRRSTTKMEQAKSLLQQEEGIKFITRETWINIEDVRSYSESRSGFENRSRDEWNNMIEDMDIVWKGGGICNLLCRDSSRLSRNPSDNIQITDRLFGDNDFKKQRAIEKIYMLWDGASIIQWTHKSDKESVCTELHNNYMNSLWTKKKSSTGIILKLEAGEFPYASPYGLERVTEDGNVYQKSLHKGQNTVLRQTSIMKFIQRVFEMKVEGKTAKEISAYLKKYAGIYMAPKKIVETLIQNTVYKGEYTETTTGLFFENIKFQEWYTPIEKSLWQKANATVWKRGNGHGKWQTEHLLVGKIKTEQGTTFQVYIAKWKSGAGKHFNYKGVSRNKKGENINVYISENDLLKSVVNELSKMVSDIFQAVGIVEKVRDFDGMVDSNFKFLGYDLYTEEDYAKYVSEKTEKYIQDFTPSPGDLPEMLSELFSLRQADIRTLSERIFALEKTHIQEMKNPLYMANSQEEIQVYFEKRLAIREKLLHEYIKDSPFFQRLQEELDFQKTGLKQLEQQRQELQKQLDDVAEDAYNRGYDKAFADRQALKIKDKLSAIDDAIRWLSGSTDLQAILAKLPSILSKIVELSSNAIGEAKIKDSREDIRLILEIVAVELLINNKKELKVELFLGLCDLVNVWELKWSHRRELNPWPLHYQWSALPLSHDGKKIL